MMDDTDVGNDRYIRNSNNGSCAALMGGEALRFHRGVAVYTIEPKNNFAVESGRFCAL